MAEWLRRSVSNHARSTRVGSNPVVGTINHKPTVNSAVHPSEVGKCVLRSNSEGTSTGQTLITVNLKLKCFIQYKNSSLFIYFFNLIFSFFVSFILTLFTLVLIISLPRFEQPLWFPAAFCFVERAVVHLLHAVQLKGNYLLSGSYFHVLPSPLCIAQMFS